MPRAVWNGAVIAESDQTIKLEGNHYFPPEALNRAYLTASARTTACPWKGRASYYDVTVDGQTNAAAAWYYPDPSPAARRIKDHVAFWHGVRIEVGPPGVSVAGRPSVAARLRSLIGVRRGQRSATAADAREGGRG